MYGCHNFCQCRENWIEIIVIILAIPEVIFLLIFIFETEELTQTQMIISLTFGGIVIILRPIVFCKRQTRTNVQSLHLPGSIIIEDNEAKDKPTERIDSVDEDIVNFYSRKSLAEQRYEGRE